MEGSHASRPPFAPILVCVQEVNEAVTIPGDNVSHENAVSCGWDGDGSPGAGLRPWAIPLEEPEALAVKDARNGRIT